MRVLVVEDDDKVGTALATALARYGIDARIASTGRSAVALAHDATTNATTNAALMLEVILLDLGLPDIDGTAVCRAIRAISDVPIIIITGRAEVGACIRSLRCGADDYLVKPYDISELLARIQAIRRRCVQPSHTDPIVRRGDVTIDLARLTVCVAGEPVPLSTKELQVLTLIAAERGEVCSHQRLIAEIWGRPWPGATSTLHVHVATLRSKLGRPGILETIRGVGYRLCRTEPDTRAIGVPIAAPS